MLTCIACSKHVNTNTNNGSLPQQEDEEDAAVSKYKPPIKALTAQIKDMAVKASGAYKNCKPCSGSSSNLEDDLDDSSEKFYGSYRRAMSSSSNNSNWGKEIEAKLKALSSVSGSATPASVSGRTTESVVFMEEDEPKEWTAQVEPGVLITFVSLPQVQGGNDLKRIRFR